MSSLFRLEPPTLRVPSWVCNTGSGHTVKAQLDRTPWCARCGAWYHRTGKEVIPDEKYPSEKSIEFRASCLCYLRQAKDATVTEGG